MHQLKKTQKRIVAILLSLVMVFTVMQVIPASVVAEENSHTVTLIGDEHSTLKLNGSTVNGNRAALTVADGKTLATAMVEQGYSLSADNGYALEKVSVSADADAKQFIATNWQSFVILTNGKAFSRGTNGFGQLGRTENAGNFSNITDFGEMILPEGVTVENLYASCDMIQNGHTVVIGSDGKAYSSGTNRYGQLGRNENVGDENAANATLTAMDLPEGVRAVSGAVGERHTLIIGSDGNAYACGCNQFGQLGVAQNRGTYAANSALVKMPLPDGVKAVSVAAGNSFSIIVGSNGKAYGCGSNYLGELGRTEGTGDFSAYLELGEMVLPEGVSAATAYAPYDGEFTVIISTDGRPFSCGCNAYGQLGRDENVGESGIANPTLVQMSIPDWWVTTISASLP